MKLNKLKNIVQSAHINFLFGSGLSRPYLNTLGNIETWLTEAENISDDKVGIKITEYQLFIRIFQAIESYMDDAFFGLCSTVAKLSADVTKMDY